MHNHGPNAILDVSATCHMPDVLEAPYRPALMQESAQGQPVRLGGPSCLAGDVIGTYQFESVPQIGKDWLFLTKRIIQWLKQPVLTVCNYQVWRFGTVKQMRSKL